MNQIEKPRRGRPPKPLAPAAPMPPRVIEVWDHRFAGNETRVGRHANVPHDWLLRDIVERFGIGDHLAIYEMATDDSRGKCLQPGKRRP